MAGYREHITVSGLLGVFYGTAAVIAFGFSAVQGALAGILMWIAGMLPDLDAEGGRPVQELSSITGAIGPLILMQHIHSMGGNPERAMLFALMLYAAFRYGGAALLAKVSVHRGMFHSIPALLISAEITFLSYASNSLAVRALMGGAVGLGFFSHLLLDEVYSVRWDGARVRLAKSSGSALKMAGKHLAPNAFSYGVLMFLTYAVLVTSEIITAPGEEPAPPEIRHAIELQDAPRYQ